MPSAHELTFSCLWYLVTMDIIVINQVRRDLSILNRICLTIYATNQSQSQRTLHNFSSTIFYLGLCFKSQKCKTTVITWLNEMWQTQNSHNILSLYLRFDIRILLLYPPVYRWSSSKLYQRCVGFTQTPGRWCH